VTTTPPLTRSELASIIDHTLLAPEATPQDVAALCAEAKGLHVYAVCVSPTLVGVAAREVAGSLVKVASVAGFPSGAHSVGLKADEAGQAASTGAAEVDMVINLGLARAGRWKEVEEEIGAVRGQVPSPTVLKVIIEASVLDDAGIRQACLAAEAAGADFVKTSTGFHPSGGATVEAVRLIAGIVRPGLGVKASGGIRTAAEALAMVAAGATRLGMSRTAAVLAELPD
jgi:deoxyribose-phosphate aldolase